jgi:hypothetical protein
MATWPHKQKEQQYISTLISIKPSNTLCFALWDFSSSFCILCPSFHGYGWTFTSWFVTLPVTHPCGAWEPG